MSIRVSDARALTMTASLLLVSGLTSVLQAGTLYVSNTSGNDEMNTLSLPGEVAGNLPANTALGNDRAIRFGPDGNLYVATHETSTVEKYDFATATWSTFATLPSGPFVPVGMTFAGDGFLYVSSFGAANGNDGTIEKFNGTTGAYDSTIVTGLNFPRGLESAGGNLYLAHGTIQEYSTAGALLNGSWGTPSATNSRGLAIGPNGNLYAAVIVTGGADGTIEEFNIATGGAPITTYSNGTLNVALDVAFDDAGFVYVTDVANNNVQRFTVAGGAYDGSFSYGVTSPDGIAFLVPEPSVAVMLLGAGLLGLAVRVRRRR
jgi:WD40 repeat protein